MPVAPIAITSGDSVSASVGVLVTLDGSSSTDPNGGSIIAYAWSISDKPPTSTVTLTGADTVSPTFIPDVVGTYRFFLEVTATGNLQSESDEDLAPSTAFSNISVPTDNYGWIIPAKGMMDWDTYLYNILYDCDTFTLSNVLSVNGLAGNVSIDLLSVLGEGYVVPGGIIEIPQIRGVTPSIVDDPGGDITVRGGIGNGDGDGGDLLLKGGSSPGTGSSGSIIVDSALLLQIDIPTEINDTLSVQEYISLTNRSAAPVTATNSLWGSDGTSHWADHIYWTGTVGNHHDLLRPRSTYSLLTCNASVVVGNIVYIDGSSVCQKALADNASTTNAIGIVVEKRGTTECYVVTSGEVWGLSGLTIGARYYLSDATAGLLTTTQTAVLGHYVAGMCIAITATRLLIQIWPPIQN